MAPLVGLEPTTCGLTSTDTENAQQKNSSVCWAKPRHLAGAVSGFKRDCRKNVVSLSRHASPEVPSQPSYVHQLFPLHTWLRMWSGLQLRSISNLSFSYNFKTGRKGILTKHFCEDLISVNFDTCYRNWQFQTSDCLCEMIGGPDKFQAHLELNLEYKSIKRNNGENSINYSHRLV